MKPVAWGMLDKDGGIYDSISPEEHDREEGAYTIPLYTHPAKTPTLVLDGNRVYPTAKTLTDEEIAEIFDTTFKVRDYEDSFIKFARAILRKAQDE